jgi:hypothetical protein
MMYYGSCDNSWNTKAKTCKFIRQNCYCIEFCKIPQPRVMTPYTGVKFPEQYATSIFTII